MAVVGEAAVEHLVLEVIGDLAADADGAKRDIRARQSLRHDEDVRHDLPVIDGEPLAGPAEPGHHFVADQQDAVLVAQRAHAFEIAIGRHVNAVGAGDRFHEEARDRLRPLEHDDFFELRQRVGA